MATVRYNLKTPYADKSLIVMVCHIRHCELDRKGNKKYKTFKYSTGLHICTKYWNFEIQRVKRNTVVNDYAEINLKLDSLESHFNNIYLRLSNEGIEPSPKTIRQEMDRLYQPTPISSKISFYDCIKDFLRKTNKMYNTIKSYRQTYRILMEFDRNLEFENINMEFYDRFIKYLKRRNYATNTIGGYIKNIKVFLNYANDLGFTDNKEHLNRRFTIPDELTDHIYLTNDELERIYSLDLNKCSRLEKVRDLFIVGCYTGLRFSDLVRISPDNIIKNDSQMKIKTMKTGEIVIIPLHWYVKNILQKYNYDLPRLISNQKMNQYLKEVGKLAGILDTVTTSMTKGGKRCNMTFKKYELVTVHTARRSFSTNAFLSDIPSLSIMKITGHRTEKAFLRYIKISQEQNADKLMNHPYFAHPITSNIN